MKEESPTKNELDAKDSASKPSPPIAYLAAGLEQHNFASDEVRKTRMRRKKYWGNGVFYSACTTGRVPISGRSHGLQEAAAGANATVSRLQGNENKTHGWRGLRDFRLKNQASSTMIVPLTI